MVLHLTIDIAWFLREKISPGQFIHPQGESLYKLTAGLRKKINSAILAFSKNQERASFPINITEEEAWFIDVWLRFDGYGNTNTTALLEIFNQLHDRDYIEEEDTVHQQVRELLGQDNPETLT